MSRANGFKRRPRKSLAEWRAEFDELALVRPRDAVTNMRMNFIAGLIRLAGCDLQSSDD